jgi:hypothetical protein
MSIAAAALATLLSGAAVASSPAAATEYPWCAQYGEGHGGTNCGFSTLAQCEAALSGSAGICERNLFYPPPPVPAPKARRPSPRRT